MTGNIMTIRELIIEKRAEVGMTQKELSEKTGITQARISDFESGKRTMTSDNIDKIFDALEIHFKQSKEELFDHYCTTNKDYPNFNETI